MGNNRRDKEFSRKGFICLLICVLSFFSLGSAWRPSPQPPESKPITSEIKGYIKDKVTNQSIRGE